MTYERIRITTRKSPLALWQARHVQAALTAAHPQLTVTLHPVETEGDKLLDAPLAKIGGKGLFVKALEQALLNEEADIAVHSMKDMPVILPEALPLVAICKREDPTDAFVSNSFATFDALPKGATVGTSSLRRHSQLKMLRPDLNVVNLRGNVQTRLTKLDDGEFDAIILATSGLKRLGYDRRIRETFAPEKMLPAVGQGALGIQSRNDPALIHLLNVLQDPVSHACVMAERAVNEKLEGGCQLPVAIYAEPHGHTISLKAQVSDVDGKHVLTSRLAGSMTAPTALGHAVGEELLAQGAGEIIQAIYND